MATTTASPSPAFNRVVLKPLGGMATAVVLAGVGLLISVKFPTASPLSAAITIGMLAVTTWMFLSERYEWSLAVLMIYLGLADGYLKLRTGSSQATLLRDLLLYAIATGALIRVAVRRESLAWPPLMGWVIAWLLVVAVQIVNPGNGTLSHTIASFRPQAEWVPLFFLGYLVMRSNARIRNFLLILLAVTAINGIVSFIQFNQTPEQLSSWGPGYERAISGEGGVSARTYTDNSGTQHTRPFGLGGDFGFGGVLGMLAIPAALALLALSRRSGVRLATGLLSFGTVLAIATSEARVAVIGSVVAVFAFAALTVTSRAGLRTVLAVGLAVVVAYATVGILSSNAKHQGSFDRYESISNPSTAVSTAIDYRRSTFNQIPEYVVDFPFGAGIGTAGPATSVAGGTGQHLNAESEPTFLLIEVGLPGLLVMLGFFLVLFYISITRIRKVADRETRLLLTAIAAPLFAIFSTGIVGTNTATVPNSPYLWFAAGILSFWLLGEGRKSLEKRAGEPSPLGGATS
jgi:hypothetical protein